MCGITGIFSEKASAHQYIEPMTRVLAHRGPDQFNTWCDPQAQISLGHQRLSVIDLSDTGNQPMFSADQRFCIVYNGEIYNAGELRRELESQGALFRGTSDTEVVLELCARYPLDVAVNKLIGMFAFGLWDKEQRCLYLVRDRMGIKPMYYYQHDRLFLFASELKAFHQHPHWKADIDRDALKSYMQFGYIRAPQSIYKNVRKLEPGSILKVNGGDPLSPRKYWDFTGVATAGCRDKFNSSETEQITSLEGLLELAVKSRLVSDVPLGAFLSGGIDSSLVVALMQKNNSSRIKTFTIGFEDRTFNEATYARDVSSHLQTDHFEFYVSSPEVLDVVPLIPEIYDEPFADPSQVPTYLVSKLTRQHVTVALSGDGGDEVFAGYKRYHSADLLDRAYRLLTPPGRRAIRAMVYAFSNDRWNRLLDKAGMAHGGDKFYKLADLMSVEHGALYSKLISHWYAPADVVIDENPGTPYLNKLEFENSFTSLIEHMQYLDSVGYLTDDILTKVDRASMAVSLEARVPILDHRVIEFAWRLPLSMKHRNGQGKWILRQILYKYLPKDLVDRTKMGFSVPLAAWLRGPLREWAESLIDKSTLQSQGYLNPETVHQKWQQHLRGDRNWQNQIWNVLMFQAWYQRWARKN